MGWRLNFGLSVLLVIYLTVGALVFYVLEFERFTPTDITTLPVFTEFLANHPNVTSGELTTFASSVAAAVRNGAVVGNATETNNGWTYDNALLFVFTVVSTVGYGHITPTTTGGKVFCMVYALVGIPLAAAVMTGVGIGLQRPLAALHRARPWYAANPLIDKRLKSVVVLMLGFVVMLCLPALVFTFTEDWDYVTGLYFSTITLTTIGFGDYVTAQNKSSTVLYRVLLCAWLVSGLAFLALTISDVSSHLTGSDTTGDNSTAGSDQKETNKGVGARDASERNGGIDSWIEEANRIREKDHGVRT